MESGSLGTDVNVTAATDKPELSRTQLEPDVTPDMNMPRRRAPDPASECPASVYELKGYVRVCSRTIEALEF